MLAGRRARSLAQAAVLAARGARGRCSPSTKAPPTSAGCCRPSRGTRPSCSRPALESLAAANNRARDRVGAALAGLGAVARELALKLSRMPQRDGAEQNRPFLDYCLARGRLARGARLRAMARRSRIADARPRRRRGGGGEGGARRRARAAAAADAAASSLLRIAADRALAVAGLAPEDVATAGRRGAGLSAARRRRRGQSRPCLPARRATAVRQRSRRAPATRVALVACDRFALLRLDGDALSGEERFAWTGWRAPGELALDIEPALRRDRRHSAARPGAERADASSGARSRRRSRLFDFQTGSGVAVAPRRDASAAPPARRRPNC